MKTLSLDEIRGIARYHARTLDQTIDCAWHEFAYAGSTMPAGHRLPNERGSVLATIYSTAWQDEKLAMRD